MKRNTLNGNSGIVVQCQPIPCDNDWKIAWLGCYLNQKKMEYFYVINSGGRNGTMVGMVCFKLKPLTDPATGIILYECGSSYNNINANTSHDMWMKHKNPLLFGNLNEVNTFRETVSCLEVCSHWDREYFGSFFCNLPYMCFCDYSIGAKRGGRGWVCAHQLAAGLIDTKYRDSVIAACPPSLNPQNQLGSRGISSSSMVIKRNISLTKPKPKEFYF